MLLFIHRWTALVFGLLLVVVSTSGALIVYKPELLRSSHADMYRATATENPVGFGAAFAAVERTAPDFAVADASLKNGVYQLTDSAEQTYFVDAGTGVVNGSVNQNGGVIGFLVNLHDCALTCEGFTGYLPWLAATSPLAELTWGALLLTIAGVTMLVLVASAPFLWWPGIRKLRNGFRVRWRKGRFARDLDLHNVIGIIALVPLLIWGLTGLNFEVPAVSTAWYAVTGGQAPPADNYTMQPSPNPGPAITLDQAMAAATQRFPNAEVTWIGMPEDDDGFYSVDLFEGGPDLWTHNAGYRGNRSVGVDAHDPGNVRVFLGPSATLSNTIADEWAQPTLHYGHSVNGYWRALWFVLGLTPLILMLTGLSTWLFRRQVRRRRAAARVAADATAAGQ